MSGLVSFCNIMYSRRDLGIVVQNSMLWRSGKWCRAVDILA